MEKKSLQQAINEIRKKFGDTAVFEGMEQKILKVDVIPTGSLTLDIALGVGGVPRGRIVEVSGPESGGKSLLCISIAAQAQKMGLKVVYVDAEHGLDPEWCGKIGLDWSKDFYFAQPETMEEALGIIETFAKTGEVGVIVWDSVPALPTIEQTAKYEKEGFGGKLVASHAKILTPALQALTPVFAKYNVCGLFINQLRYNIGVMFGNPESTPGGKALKHFASVRMRVAAMGGKKIENENEEPIGHRVRVRIEKNKVAPPFKTAEFDLYYDRGIDARSEIVEAGLKKGIIKRPTNKTYEFGDRKWLGKSELENHIQTDDALVLELTEAIKNTKGTAEVKEPLQGAKVEINNEELEEMSKSELREKAKKLGIVYANLKKEDLVIRLKEVDLGITDEN